MAREDIANLAMEAAAKVIGANVSAETNSDIFDEFLNESNIIRFISIKRKFQSNLSITVFPFSEF